VPVVLLALVYGLLWLPPVQRKITDAALEAVMKKTQNQLSIGKIDFRPFNRLQLQEVYAGDRQGDTLLYAGRVSAGFNLLGLLDNRLRITSVRLEDFVVQVQKDRPDGDFNFQFLIDAFAPESPDSASSSLDIRIRDIRLKRGRIHYRVLSEPVLPDSLFDVNRIRLEQVDAKIDIRLPATGDGEVRIRSLSFAEKSGLQVTHLQAILQWTGGQYRLREAQLRLPHSQLAMAGEYGDSGAFRLTWEDTKLHLPDLKMVYPALAAFPEKLKLEGEVKGTLPAINLSRFQADYGKHAHLQLQASIADYTRWQEAPLRLLIKPSSVDALLVEKFLPGVPPAAITFNGSLQGALPHLTGHLTAGSAWADIRAEGEGGYNFRTNEAHAGARATIDRFDYMGYSYHRMGADIAYRGDSIQLHVACEDENLPLELQASADIGTKTPGLTLDAHLKGIYLDTLHLLPHYRDAFLTGRLRADVRGWDVETMRADLCIDSLTLTTNKGAFFEPHFHLFYDAAGKNSKRLEVRSVLVNAQATGNFTYAGLLQSVRENFPVLFPGSTSRKGMNNRFPETFGFRIGMNELSSIADLLELPREIPDSALITGKYSNDGQNMKLSASAYTRFLEADTLQLSLSLSSKDSRLAVIFNVDNKSSNYDVDGSIDAEVEFVPEKGRLIPGMNILFNPTIWVLNETAFDFRPASMEVRDERYLFHNLLLSYAEHPGEYIRVDGVASASEADSLMLDIAQFRLSTLFGAVKTDIPLSGVVEGRVTAHSLLATPRVQMKDFAIRQVAFDDHPVGDLKVNAGWDNACNGWALDAALGRDGRAPSVVTGRLFPDADSLVVWAKVRDIELQWFQKWVAGSVFGLSGSLGADVHISGKISQPAVSGILRAHEVQAGIPSLNTLYALNDSVSFNSESIDLGKLTVYDTNRQTLTVTGTVTHHRFSGFIPKINLMLNDFLVLDNERQVDSLFYGHLRVNGLLTVKQSGKDWLISGDVTHSNNARFTVNLPASASTAERYNHMLTYITAEPEEPDPVVKRSRPQTEEEPFSLPLKINASLWFDPGLTIGAFFNPPASDAAHVNGNGKIRLTYDMRSSAMNLLGDYEITSGNVNLSLAKITKKTFAVQNGGKLIFHGNPMETSFNLTALYNLRADLKTLDPSFGNLGIVNTKVPVSCSLTATGNIDRMALEYDILLPSESDDIQRKVDGLLYTDDMKIKQIAYLLALGSFMPASSDSPDLGGRNIVNSLASLTSGGLNKLLAGVLSDKWSIRTDVQTGDAGLSDMAINVSGSMLNDRLTINGTVGYHDNAGQMNNFTGDFDVEYQLVPSGNLVLKAYNVTNNQYYEQAATTQGVGVVYKREARTFRKLFDRFKKKQ
jgi:hypothetical protein